MRAGFGKIGLVLLATCAACEDTASAPVDYGQLLQSLTENVILPKQSAFVDATQDLDEALGNLEASPDADSLAQAQSAWRAARVAYRNLDALYFGPVADLGISERIDLEPARGPDIDALVAGKKELELSVVDEAGGHSKGFLGIEYLLFSREGDEAALARLSDDDDLGSRRRTLVRLMGDELLASAHELYDAWDPAKGGYATEIEQAGAGSKRYPTQRAAIDDVVGGIAFALELVVGVRLAEPLGKRGDGTPEPALDPTSASDSATADMQATLDGVRALYDGDGLSLRARSKNTVLDERIRTQLDDCGARIESIPAPFSSALTDDTAKVEGAYQACKVAKGTWNTDVTSALGATLKPSDNDGD